MRAQRTPGRVANRFAISVKISSRGNFARNFIFFFSRPIDRRSEAERSATETVLARVAAYNVTRYVFFESRPYLDETITWRDTTARKGGRALRNFNFHQDHVGKVCVN